MLFLSAPLLLALLLLFVGILWRGTTLRLCRLFVSGQHSGAAFCGLRGVSKALILCVNGKKPGTQRVRIRRSMLRKSASLKRGSRWQPLSHGRGDSSGCKRRSRSAFNSASDISRAVFLRGLGMGSPVGGAGRSLPARATS
jgi:hypothetical protein